MEQMTAPAKRQNIRMGGVQMSGQTTVPQDDGVSLFYKNGIIKPKLYVGKCTSGPCGRTAAGCHAWPPPIPPAKGVAVLASVLSQPRDHPYSSTPWTSLKESGELLCYEKTNQGGDDTKYQGKKIV